MTRQRLEELWAKYGRVAVFTYLAIFALVLAGFATAIRMGFDVESTEGSVGTMAGAWLATKVTQPIRIGATLVLTPFIARVVQRLRSSSPENSAAE